jgi:hypothetical protein
MAPGSTQPLTERRTVPQPYGLPRPVTGIDLPFFNVSYCLALSTLGSVDSNRNFINISFYLFIFMSNFITHISRHINIVKILCLSYFTSQTLLSCRFPPSSQIVSDFSMWYLKASHQIKNFMSWHNAISKNCLMRNQFSPFGPNRIGIISGANLSHKLRVARSNRPNRARIFSGANLSHELRVARSNRPNRARIFSGANLSHELRLAPSNRPNRARVFSGANLSHE